MNKAVEEAVSEIKAINTSISQLVLLAQEQLNRLWKVNDNTQQRDRNARHAAYMRAYRKAHAKVKRFVK